MGARGAAYAQAASATAVSVALAMLAPAPAAGRALTGPPAAPPQGSVAQAGPAEPERCAVELARPLSGAAAVDALGDRLAEVAARVERTAAELAGELRRDPSLHVDRCGSPFYVEPIAPEAAATDAAGADAASTAAVTGGTPDASGDPFALHSRPGSARTVYLDFTGHQVTGTDWNSAPYPADFWAPPFDTDGDPAGFTAAEQDVVRSVWLRVAEDFAPFDVDVTTSDPGTAALTREGTADSTFGMRVLVTSYGLMHEECACAGLAYVDVFDMVGGARYQPAFVLQRGAGSSAKALAEVASHEVGHTLNLVHDGVAGGSEYYEGHMAWAPIMGLGSLRPVTQWSRGEYVGASNAEDDVAVMAGNGMAAVVDDHPESGDSATAVAPGATVTGLVSSRADVDAFAVTVAVPSRLTATGRPQSVSPDLDAALEVRDGSGAVLAAADPPVAATSSDTATGLGATVTVAVPAGTYTVRVDGVGAGSAVDGYSDYASLGRYALDVSAEPTATTTTEATSTATATSTTTPTSTATPASTAAPASTLDPVVAGEALTTAALPAATSEPTPAPAGPATAPAPFAGSLRRAVEALAVRRERDAGWSRSRFGSWTDADGDCQDTRAEVLVAESRVRPRFAGDLRCVVAAGRWRSTYDSTTVGLATRTRTVATVPLREAWQSGARGWTATRRAALANDLRDPRTLRVVSATGALRRAEREVTEWLPRARCGYAADWVAVKLRWGLSVDRAERRLLRSVAADCSVRLTVTWA